MFETRSTALMTIGEFSRQSRLTPKALRLYDALGLIEPRFTDPQSGYRYYLADQLERAQLIALLRQLEMPLNRIATVLELPRAAAAQEIGAYWREVKANLRAGETLVAYLVERLEEKEVRMFKIETRSVPERKLACIQQRVFKDGIGQFIPNAHATLAAQLAAAGATPVSPPFVIYYGLVDVDSDGPAEACVAFTGSLEPKGQTSIRLEPAHEEAYIVMTRGSVEGPELMQGYDALFAWAREHGKSEGMIAAGREIYFEPADWNSLGMDQPAFDVAVAYL